MSDPIMNEVAGVRDVERCETCRFWAGEKMVADEPYPVVGKCKRRAPVATGGMMSAPETIWPQTALHDWCGEYSNLLSERDQ